MKLISGHVVLPPTQAEVDKLHKDFKAYPRGLSKIIPGRWVLPLEFKNYATKIYNFQLVESDVLVMTYPKCGTTWMQEIIWTMKNNPNLDHPDAGLPVAIRSPFLELDAFMPPLRTEDVLSSDNELSEAFKRWCPGRRAEDGIYMQLAECLPDPRVLKTHLPFPLLSPYVLDRCKVVYMARNPKDVIVSYHHHSRINRGMAFVGSFGDFVQYFVDDELLLGPYWLHLKEAWERTSHPNLHFVFYEDMKENPLGEIEKLNSFLNTNLEREQLERIIKYTSFGEMQTRDNAVVGDATIGGTNMAPLSDKRVKMEGGFFRKGEAGDWKDKFTPHLDALVGEWIHKNLDGLGIKFNYGEAKELTGKL